MSRQSAFNSAPNPLRRELSPEQQAERLSYSSAPNVKGTSGAVKRIKDRWDIEVTEYYIRRAVSQRRLARHEICHVIHFSDRDLYDFIVLGTRKTDEPKDVA